MNPLRLLAKYYKYHVLGKADLSDLIFFVTYKCNFRCGSCFYVDTMETASQNNKELTIEEIEKVSLKLGKLRTLLLSGGEPFLRDDLARLCRIFHLNNKIHHLHLPTNGFYTEKIFDTVSRILNSCQDLRLTLSLPLDGMEKTHDEIKGVPGSFNKVTETVNRLSALKSKFPHLYLYMISVVSNKNIGQMPELAEYVKNNLPVDGHGPSPLRGQAHDAESTKPTYKDWHEVSKKLLPYQYYWNSRNNNKIKAYLLNRRIEYLYALYTHVLERDNLPFKCMAGRLISVLEPNGDVRLCELTDAVGNIRNTDYDIMKVLSSDRAKAMLKRIESCACTHACFLNPSITMNPYCLIDSYLKGSL